MSFDYAQDDMPVPALVIGMDTGQSGASVQAELKACRLFRAPLTHPDCATLVAPLYAAHKEGKKKIKEKMCLPSLPLAEERAGRAAER